MDRFARSLRFCHLEFEEETIIYLLFPCYLRGLGVEFLVILESEASMVFVDLVS